MQVVKPAAKPIAKPNWTFDQIPARLANTTRYQMKSGKGIKFRWYRGNNVVAMHYSGDNESFTMYGDLFRNCTYFRELTPEQVSLIKQVGKPAE